MKQITNSLFILSAAMLLYSCSSARSEEKVTKEEVIPVKVLPVKQELLQSQIHASGQFTTEDETFLSFKTGGIINQVLVEEGDAVRKGQLLATLHLTEISAQVQQATFNYEKALRDYNRYSNLYKDSVATLEQFQNVKTALDIAQQQLAASRFNQNYSQIRATADGYVLKKLANAGQMIEAGSPVLQTNGAGQKDWNLKVGVSDMEWNTITVGDAATVYTDAYPDRAIKARVTKKSEGVDPGTGTFSITIAVQGTTSRIAAGMYGKAVIYPSKNLSAWTLPYDALLDGDAGEAFVFVTNDYKSVKKVKVRISAIDKEKVIIGSGLEKATAVITSGSAYLKEGSSIKVIQ